MKTMMTLIDYKNLAKILDRIEHDGLFDDTGVKRDRISMMMDLEFANADTPLDFAKLLAFDNFNFCHDVFGIYKHMNRVTKKLDGHFLPRCAK